MALLMFFRQRRAGLATAPHDVGNDHVEAGEHRVRCGDAMQLAVTDISELHAVAGIADLDAGAVETDAHR
jgi:hypothetical protein